MDSMNFLQNAHNILVLSAIQLVPLLQTTNLFITSIQIHPQTSAHMSTRKKKKKKKKKPVLHSNPNTELLTHAHKEERVKQSLAYAVHTPVSDSNFFGY